MLLLGSGSAVSTLAAEPEFEADVQHYAVTITPDVRRRQVSGRAEITVRGKDRPTSVLRFDAGDLEVTAVLDRGRPVSYTKQAHALQIHLSPPLRVGEVRRLSISYHGSPTRGLEFHPERGELYTVFSTSQWMPCVDSPSERATLDLTLRLPPGMKSVGTGREIGRQNASGSRWRLDTPMPSYLYGFAAGRYAQFSQKANGYTLRFLSTDRSPRELQGIFKDTSDMLHFFTERAGLRFSDVYTQVLVTKTIGQELAGVSLLSETYGTQVLADPTALSLMAHEAAHQWWGNLLTSKDWRHFWLNEGFATFMAAAYLEHRFGAAEYSKQVDSWRNRLDKLRADGKDKPLVYPDWKSPTADDRAVVYQKGAYVLHVLREELGEAAFWRGIREYTKAHAGRSVETKEFETAMEDASGRNLAEFFRVWVLG